ncbi:hypothetical protein H5410_014853 [Solanum commersonii]|uniref:Uncharacterized protein n=1 Tax=Solanum commersonii TaxID=4109 RepID=A0A9J5ZS05_SOLCO|nr:hypothetical protein H5410_014853 [Solanum commersonii]
MPKLSHEGSLDEPCNFGRSPFASRNYSAIHRLPLFYRLLGFFPQGWHIGPLGGQNSHLVTRQVLLAIINLAFLHFCCLFCSFLPACVLAFLLNPYT